MRPAARLRPSAFLPLLAAAAACGAPGKGPWMTPGEDCLACHGASRTAQRVWSVGGTVYDVGGRTVAGARVVVTDAGGKSLTMTSNGEGNFYTAEPLAEPLRAIGILHEGRQQDMPMPAGDPPLGACNGCHSPGGAARSRILVPVP